MKFALPSDWVVLLSELLCCQGEPEFARLKQELEDVNSQPRALEGTFRTAAELERHRVEMADAAIEKKLAVQAAFKEHGGKLQAIYEKRGRIEADMSRRTQEIKQLKGEGRLSLTLMVFTALSLFELRWQN